MDINYGHNSHSDLPLSLSLSLFGNPEKLTTHKEFKTANIYYILYNLRAKFFENPY